MKIPSFVNLRNISALALTACLAAYASHISPFVILEKRLFDLSFKIRGAEPPHPDLVIIDIDDDTLKKIGVWPWPRVYHGQFLKILAPVNAKVIFYDIFFSEKSTDHNDSVFADGMQKAGNVILSYYFKADRKEEMKEPWGMPIEPLAKVAKGTGYVNIFPDPDGRVREIPLKHLYQNHAYYHASLATAAEYHGWNKKELEEFPTDPVLINYPGPYNNFKIIPFLKIFSAYGDPRGKALYDSLRDKVILVGHTATGTSIDIKSTPFSPNYPGVGVQASMINTLLTGKFINRLSLPLHTIFLFLFICLIALFTQVRSTVRGFLWTLLSVVILFGIIQAVFIWLRIWVPFGSFLSASSLVFFAITFSSFVKVQFEKEVLFREMSLANKIQTNLLKSEMPVVPGLEIAALTLPARHVGGDLYDIVLTAHDQCGISIGDVSGKGVPAALFMSKAISEFRREAQCPDPAVVLKNLNNKLSEGGFSGLFITLLYTVINAQTRSFTYANGGHDPLFFYQKSTRKVTPLTTEIGGPLGIDGDSEFDQKQGQAEVGDILLFETDGIKEAMNSKKELFGLERIQSAVIEAADKSPREILEHLKLRVEQFVKNAPQHDDMTIVCAKFI